jgi:prepilin-type N-terminal cleavage/methylation domain-containing protein
MPPYRRYHRDGMTLVELLVVVVILLVLAATVLPLVAGTAESRRSREAARTVASFIAKAQSRSIGRQQWSGFTIVPTGTASAIALTLYLADVPSPYMGDSARTVISGTGPSAGRWTGTTTLAGDLTTGTAMTRAGDLIRLDGRGPLYEITAITTGSLVFQMRTVASGSTENAGQSQHNTPWPAPAPATHTFEILQQPLMSGSPLSLAENRAIDLTYCGHGSTSNYSRFAAGSTVSVLFDGSGQLRQIVTIASSGSVSRVWPTGPVFLLVGRADRVGTSGTFSLSGTNDSAAANWKYGDSTWIGIDPMTGLVKTAGCDVSTTVVSQTIPVPSQNWIRQALLSTGQ